MPHALDRHLNLRAALAALCLAGALVSALALGGVLRSGATTTPARQQRPVVQASAALAGLPLAFEANRGQLDSRAAFFARGERASVFFTPDGVRYSLADTRRDGRRFGLELGFVGARDDARPVGVSRTGAEVSYFRGRAGESRTGVPTYEKVAYRDLWPGVDLVYTGAGGRLKYNLVVAPGADPSAIELAWRGATTLGVDGAGRMNVATSAGALREQAPVSYQRVGDRRVPVESSYALGAGKRYGFRLGNYDRTRPLVIDPAVLVYAGYLGGRRDDAANNTAVDRKGALYVTGATLSGQARFPDRLGPDRSFNGGTNDAFVAKVDPSGKRLAYAGYIGGSGDDGGLVIAVDRRGAAYVTGTTESTEATFPVRKGPDTTYGGGPRDAFVAKVGPSGRRLEYAGYIGGSGNTPPPLPNEQANGIAVDGSGNAYVSGFTASSESQGFPVTVGSFDSTFNGFVDTFVVKVKRDGTGFAYGGYIGGSAVDPGTGVAVDRAGNAYVNGFVGSTQATFPDGDGFGSVPGFDRTFNGAGDSPIPDDAYIAKVARDGKRLVYATYIGGAGVEQPFGNAVDRKGNAYLTGRTSSRQDSFPDGDGFGGIPGPDQTFNGATDAFVVKVRPAGTSLAYAGYIGGAGNEDAVGLDLDSAGSMHVFGTTDSRQRSFPVRSGPDRTYNGGPSDAYIAKVAPRGGRLDYAGYIGGSGDETGIGLALDAAGSAYVAGTTDSRPNSFPVRLGPDRSINGRFGDTDAFVAKVSTERCQGRPVTQVGTPGPDRITGTPRRDVIAGLGGRDVIAGRGGNDLVCGGPGNDRLDGGRGRDRCAEGGGRDRVRRC